jgi:hypothetical protein
MFGRRPTLQPYDVSAKLYRAADLIAEASSLLDDACCGSASTFAKRIEAIKGLSSIDRILSREVTALADAIQAEYEAEDDGLDTLSNPSTERAA